jgi:hypothetical protein
MADPSEAREKWPWETLGSKSRVLSGRISSGFAGRIWGGGPVLELTKVRSALSGLDD